MSAAATGAGGGVTLGVIVAFTYWPRSSTAWYLTAVAVPVNVGSGSKVTVPFALIEYVPWFSTTSVVTEQVFGVSPEPQSFKVESGCPVDIESFKNGEIV